MKAASKLQQTKHRGDKLKHRHREQAEGTAPPATRSTNGGGRRIEANRQPNANECESHGDGYGPKTASLCSTIDKYGGGKAEEESRSKPNPRIGEATFAGDYGIH